MPNEATLMGLSPTALLRRHRLVLGFFILALILSGVTAFPLRRELDVLVAARGFGPESAPAAASGLDHWLITVRDGLRDTYAKYPWIAYGTDWLAFAHIVIAIYLLGAWRDPLRNIWALHASVIACLLVVPLALICGPLRGIPFGWRLIDCSFGVFGLIPLCYCLRLTRRLRALGGGDSRDA